MVFNAELTEANQDNKIFLPVKKHKKMVHSAAKVVDMSLFIGKKQ